MLEEMQKGVEQCRHVGRDAKWHEASVDMLEELQKIVKQV